MEKQRDRGGSSGTSLGNLAGNGRGEGRKKDFSEGCTEEAINHRVKKRSSTTVTAESSRGVRQILSFLIVLKETALSCSWKSDADFELRCIRRPWNVFSRTDCDTELAPVLVQKQSLHELVHYNTFISCFFPCFLQLYDSKKTVPIRSIHSTTIIHTVQQQNMNEAQNNELVKYMEASQFILTC